MVIKNPYGKNTSRTTAAEKWVGSNELYNWKLKANGMKEKSKKDGMKAG